MKNGNPEGLFVLLSDIALADGDLRTMRFLL